MELKLSSTFQSRITDILTNLQLSNPIDNTILQNRFLYEVMYYEQKRDKSKKYYNGFRFIVTTGSILLPAILSIGQMDPNKLPDNFDMLTYWASWSISLAVTISNGFLQLFSIDKQYFTYSVIVEQLKTEGWQFVQLSGKYDQFESHESAYKMFSKSVETIKRKQIEQEYSSGKVDNKKQKKSEFDFQKELMGFQNKYGNAQEKVNLNIKDTMNETISKAATSIIKDQVDTIIDNTVTNNTKDETNNDKESKNNS